MDGLMRVLHVGQPKLPLLEDMRTPAMTAATATEPAIPLQ
jgi:hypothetical protein